MLSIFWKILLILSLIAEFIWFTFSVLLAAQPTHIDFIGMGLLIIIAFIALIFTVRQVIVSGSFFAELIFTLIYIGLFSIVSYFLAFYVAL